MTRHQTRQQAVAALLALVTLVSAVTAGIAFTTNPTPVSAHEDHEEQLGTTADDDFRNETVLSDLDQPISVDFLPDGRMVVLQKGGEIRIADPQTGESETYMTITDLKTNGERGVIDIALDPNFEENGYFYLYYVPESTYTFRISQFTHQEREGGLDSRGDLSSEEMLWEDNDDSRGTCCHFGGGLDVGPDGMLYLTTGEEFNGSQAQDLSESGGKIIRINRDGSVPNDNPFVDDPDALDTIWAYGLRNPYTASWDEQSDRFYIGEVGGNNNTDDPETTSWEDIHVGREGANYGWPDCEGNCSDDAYDDPVYTYPHTSDVGGSVIAGTVYRGEQYPSGFDGALFYGDYVRGWIKYLTFDDDGEVTGSHEFHTNAGAVVSIAEGPDGALYYADIRGGTVTRIEYVGDDAPTIESASASPTSGEAPLDVEFTGEATDPNGDALTYTWEFGDGANVTGQNVTHTYEDTGSYTARLRVSDGNQTVQSDSIDISVGAKPEATIEAPENGSLFRAGENVTYSGSATDPDDGELTGDDLQWTVEFVHNEHTHPTVDNDTGADGSFHIETSGHDYHSDTGYKITLTATDSDGLTDTDTVYVRPDKVNVTFASEPSGVNFDLDGIPRTTSFTYDTLVNFEHQVNAPATQCVDGTRYEFVGWSDGGDRSRTYTVPDSDATLTADYEANGTCDAESGLPRDGLALHLEADRGVSTSDGTVTGWADHSGNGNDLSATGDPSLTTSPGGQPAIGFDGEGDMLRRDGVNGLPTGDDDRTMFVVAKYDGHGEGDLGGVAYGTPNSNQAFGLVVDEEDNLALQGWSTENDYHSTTAGVGAGWLTQSAVLNDGSFVHYRNGTEIDSGTHVFDTGDDRITVGGEMTPPPYTEMEVSAVIVYNRSLSGAEYQQVNSHLEEKYLRGSDDGDETTNEAPTANAGEDRTVEAGETVTLDGSGSTDADGDALTYEWNQTAGSEVTLSSDGANDTVTFTAPNVENTMTLTFDLNVTDGGASDTDTVSVTVEPTESAPTDGGDGENDETDNTDSPNDNTDSTDNTSDDTDNTDNTGDDTDNTDSTDDNTDNTDNTSDDTDTTDSDGDDGTSAGSDENAGSETGDDGNAADGAPNESAAGSAAFDVTVDGPGTATLSVGDQVTVTVHVENVGDARGARTVTFGVDGRTVGTDEVDLPVNATRTVQFNQTFDSTGTYEVSVDGTTIATVEVVDEGAQSNDTDTVTGSATPEGGTDDGQTDDRTDDRQMGVSTPGFGFGVAFAALLALALTLGAAARRR